MPLDSPASFRPIPFTFCVLKLCERIILSRLLFFLESNFILSPRQAGFRPGWSTLDQILYLSQSISDGFNKPRPGSRTIFSTIDFSKAFDSVWHLALYHKPVVLKLCVATPRCVVSVFQGRREIIWFSANKSRFYCVKRTLIVDSFLFSSNINNQLYFHNSVFNTLLLLLTCYSRIKLQKFSLIGEKYIKNKAFSYMLDENGKDELYT